MRTIPCGNPFGAPVYHEETVSSTMDAARLLAGQGEAHGTVIVADFQAAGRGRLRRLWKMEKGQSLSFTILLRYPDLAALPPALTLKAGLAVSLAVEDFAPPLSGLVRVKWPNDVMLVLDQGRAALKTAGILAEAEGPLVYLGIGVNLAQREFPEDLRNKAGSLLSALEALGGGGKPAADLASAGSRFRLLEQILVRLHGELEAGGESWKGRLEDRLYKRGERVCFAEGAADSQKIVEGRLAGIGGGGELVLIPDGETEGRLFVTGELRVYFPP